MQEPENTNLTGRNPDGTWKKGFCPNPGGRKKNPLKEFSLNEFNSWTDQQKSEFLNKISPYDRWRMTEGNPPQETILEGGERPIPILGDIYVHKDNSDKQNSEPDQENKSDTGGNGSE